MDLVHILTLSFFNINFSNILSPTLLIGAWGSVVVKTLLYYSDDLGIDSRCCH